MSETLIERLRDARFDGSLFMRLQAADALTVAQARIAELEASLGTDTTPASYFAQQYQRVITRLAEVEKERDLAENQAVEFGAHLRRIEKERDEAQARIERLERALEEAENIARAIDSGRGNESMIADEIARRRSVLFPDQEGELERDPKGSGLSSLRDQAPSDLDPAGVHPSREVERLQRENGWLRSGLAEAVELVEMDDEFNTPGTDAYTWLVITRDLLASAGEAGGEDPQGLRAQHEHAAPQSGEAPNEALKSLYRHGKSLLPPSPTTEERDQVVRALLVLTDAAIPPDLQELLVYGNVMRGVAPGALAKAIRAASSPSTTEERLRQALEEIREIALQGSFKSIWDITRAALSPADEHGKGGAR